MYPDKIQMYAFPLAKSPIWWPSLFPGYMHVTTDSTPVQKVVMHLKLFSKWQKTPANNYPQTMNCIYELWARHMFYRLQQSFPPLPHPYRSLLTHWLLSTAMIYIFQVHLLDITILTHTVYDMRYRQSYSLESQMKFKSRYTCTVYWHFLMPVQVSWRTKSDQHTDPGDKSLK